MARKAKTLPKTFRLKAEVFGLSIAQHDISTMLNPENQGPNWDWAKFPQWARSRARLAWQAFTPQQWDKWKDKIIAVAGDSAAEVATEFLQESDILNWSHKLK